MPTTQLQKKNSKFFPLYTVFTLRETRGHVTFKKMPINCVITQMSSNI
jgi:hypothetical protein